jgi:hypothetical protein
VIKRPAFALSPAQNLEVKRQLTEYINKGFMQPSHSPWGAPVFLVKKPHSDKWRLVCDWRGLNKLTIRDRFEIPMVAGVQVRDALQTLVRTQAGAWEPFDKAALFAFDVPDLWL